MASCCCLSRSILAVSRLATAVFTREPPSSQRGTLVLATLPRVIAVCEMSRATSPIALLRSVHVIESYFAASTVLPSDEQPAKRTSVITRIKGGAVVEFKFMSHSARRFADSIRSIDPKADGPFRQNMRPAKKPATGQPLRPAQEHSLQLELLSGACWVQSLVNAESPSRRRRAGLSYAASATNVDGGRPPSTA